jgi:GNAT superfamily N-acetyltransferase
MKRLRLWLPLDHAAFTEAPRDPFCRAPVPDDAAGIAELMYHAYRGTIDDAGETPEDARAEVAKFFAGGYGPFLFDMSELTFRHGRIAAATLLTLWEGLPLLAMSMTHPDFKRQGMARAGLARAIHRLRDQGYTQVHLAVTVGNPAEDLYRSFGFREYP